MNKFIEFSRPRDSFHTLPIILANELYRMRQRVSSIPSDIGGKGQLIKSFERLEDELKNMGYEFPELLDTDYDEGMTLKASFIPSENISVGVKKITRVIKPQVNYNGQLIQIAEVEVTVGIKD